MPELPEVETIARGLRAYLLNKQILDVHCHYLPILCQAPEVFKRTLVDQKFEQIKRRGKYLFLVLSNLISVVVHLRMTGQLRLVDRDREVDKHTHLEIMLDGDAKKLIYRDVRKFGRLELTGPCGYTEFIQRKKLGPDAMETSPEELHRRFTGARRNLKTVLMDQSVIAGLGNIYTDEILFHQKLSPLKKANTLTEDGTSSLLKTIKEVLLAAILKRGTTVSDYSGAFGQEGSYQGSLLVYGQEGKPCPCCGCSIEKMRVAGRGTYICSHCQRI